MAVTLGSMPRSLRVRDVIEVELEDEGEALLYEIKILTSTGRVRELQIDARTGVVVSIEDD